ncbi:MAG: flagellar protein [Campylobacterales bacterium]|nr:flagellar protein [Campylobacterales bacterium]
MLKILLLAFFTTFLFALEISIDGAKENFSPYSTLHLKNEDKFLCQESRDDFDTVTQIICAFTKQPKLKLKPIQNDFFSITTEVKNKTFFLIIKPFKKMQLFPVIFDLKIEDTIFDADVSVSKHWMIVGYVEEIPFLKKEKKSDVSINFPFYLQKDKLPYVGGLDIKGNPVDVQEVKDVGDFLNIKQLFADKKYSQALDLIEDVEQKYPNSLFNVELLYYKIKSYSALNDHDNVVENAKIYLREYSSDENIAEILSLNAKAYSLLGMNTDADYFFDRLFNEHQDSEFMHLGAIYKGQMLEDSGDSVKAATFYDSALNNTKDIDIAVEAAYRLANNLLVRGDSNESAKYIQKIVSAKSDYFAKELIASLDMMYTFENVGDYLSAATIAKSILDGKGKSYDDYERLLKDRALWLCKTDKTQEALDAIDEYLKEFSDGTYEEEILVAKDSLFFESVHDGNFTQKLEQYNTLIDNYQDTTIANKAIYEKGKLLLENKKYSDVLDFKDALLSLDEDNFKYVKNIIEDASIALMEESLKDKKCKEVLTISYDYNISLSNEWDNDIYDCAMMGGDFELSKKIASSNLNVDDLDDRKKWLYKYIKVDFATGNYSDVVSAAKELITLIEDDKDSEYLDVYRVLFDTYNRLEKKDELLNSILDLENIYGLDYRDIDRYAAVMGIGIDTKDDNIIVKYAQKILDIQNSSASNPQSPYVEFSLYQAYLNKEELNKALDTIVALDNIELNPIDRARQKYLLGSVYTKLWRDDEAKKAYNEAIKADENSPWANLAKSALNF